jgi:hypothetical protein
MQNVLRNRVIQNVFIILTKYIITFLLRVSVCYIHHLQGESRIDCTKPSGFKNCVVYVTLVVSQDTKYMLL